jgi:hypothetical protein
MSRIKDGIRRLWADASEAVSTPAGVNFDLLPTYCPPSEDGTPDFSGKQCESRRK